MSSYEEAGVSRDSAQKWVETLSSKLDRIRRPEVLSRVGDFGAFFEAPKNYQDPIWVATTDGVGTKLLLAEEMGSSFFEGIGQDLVAMSVNDLLACRAEALIFLDYLATGKLDPERDQFLIEGILKACQMSACSLVGGETAEMPGVYPVGRVDVAGFAMGVIEREARFMPESVKAGDLVLGFPSSGFHSNGYSLIRRILSLKKKNLSEDFEGKSLGELLLAPTKVYGPEILKLLRRPECVAAVHVTGGGLIENIPRVLPKNNLKVEIQTSSWEIPSLMNSFCEWGAVEKTEAFSTWNMGIGFCAVVHEDFDQSLWKSQGAQIIGRVVKSDGPTEVILR
jgi:phosphoribosylformylglycinamidine cyclo-ligase